MFCPKPKWIWLCLTAAVFAYLLPRSPMKWYEMRTRQQTLPPPPAHNGIAGNNLLQVVQPRAWFSCGAIQRVARNNNVLYWLFYYFEIPKVNLLVWGNNTFVRFNNYCTYSIEHGYLLVRLMFCWDNLIKLPAWQTWMIHIWCTYNYMTIKHNKYNSFAPRWDITLI